MKIIAYLCIAFLSNVTYASHSANAEKQLNQYIDSIFVANGMTYSEAETILFSFKKRVKTMANFNKYVKHKLKRAKVFETKKFKKIKRLIDVARISEKIINGFEDELYQIIKTHNLWEDDTFITRMNLVHHNFNYWGLKAFKPITIYDNVNSLNSYTENNTLVNKLHLIYYVQKLVFDNDPPKKSNLLAKKLSQINVELIPPRKKDSSDIEITDENHKDLYEEIDPLFPGGENLMFSFINSNFIYPEMAREFGMQGTIYIQFVIDINGNATEVKIVKTTNKTMTPLWKESIRIVEAMPRWKPAYQCGKTVNVRYILPIKCSIN